MSSCSSDPFFVIHRRDLGSPWEAELNLACQSSGQKPSPTRWALGVSPESTMLLTSLSDLTLSYKTSNLETTLYSCLIAHLPTTFGLLFESIS